MPERMIKLAVGVDLLADTGVSIDSLRVAVRHAIEQTFEESEKASVTEIVFFAANVDDAGESTILVAEPVRQLRSV